MKNMIKVLWYTIISAMVLAMFTTAKVFAHGEGKCFTRAFLKKGSYVEVESHLEGEALNIKGKDINDIEKPPYKHGHVNQYYDINGDKTTPSTSFFDVDFDRNEAHDDFYVDCSTLTPSPQPPAPRTSTRLPRNPVNGCDPEPETVTPQRSTPQPQHSNGSRQFACDSLTFENWEICHDWDFTDRYRLIGFPVLPHDVITVSDLHNLFTERLGKQVTFKNWNGRVWHDYRGSEGVNPEIGEIEITPHFALYVELSETFGITGHQVHGKAQGEILELSPGIHFIGLPEIPSNYEWVSDLLIDGIEWVRLYYTKKWWLTIDSPGESNDRQLRAGLGIRIKVTKDVTLDLRGSISETAAAPMAQRQGTLATSWGELKRIP